MAPLIDYIVLQVHIRRRARRNATFVYAEG
jgi:hypothetical protein